MASPIGMAASGTTSASERRRSIMPANSAEAATGETPGTCHNSRAATSKPIRKTTSATSIQRSGEFCFACGTIGVKSMLLAKRQSITLGGINVSRHPRRRPAGPIRNNGFQRIEAVGQCGGAGLQNERRLDLAKEPVAHRRNGVEARAGREFRRHEFLAAPRADHDIGPCRDHCLGGDDAVLGALLRGEML